MRAVVSTREALLDRLVQVAERDERVLARLDALHASIDLYRQLREEAQSPELVPRAEAEAAVLDYVAEIERSAH